MHGVRKVLTGTAAMVLAAVVGAGTAQAAPPGAQGPPATAAAPDPGTGLPSTKATKTVTLITGDRVTMTPDGTAVGVRPGAGRERMSFARSRRDGDVSVIPADALPLVAAGRLDQALFNVTGLLRLGYDDAVRADLPLIVSYDGAAPRAAVAGARATRDLPAVHGAAVTADKTGTYWRSLTGSTPGLLAARKVWLDGQARLLDDASNAQIGAPLAWAAGYTGKGVTVADLDGGYDPDHPDLRGVVTASQDFTGTSIRDGFGHGTHTASTIAGSGVASGGKYKGVAPDAKLIVGKVCEDSGGCPFSAIIAGMQWAADQHAAAANMSLGGGPSDGTDPLSEAVNNLTAASGTLFVIAAGNAGRPDAVSSPGAADAALTVGSVTKSDQLSAFSSRGPRVGDKAIKPDITAPGSDIIAARAAGTFMGDPVDQYYTSASGTSMATPHVTGAVAVLAQQHPDWKAPQLKAALMSTTAVLPGLSVYDQGAGRLDLGRATRQAVSASPGSLSLGFFAWPHGQPPSAKAVTYRNDGDAPVTLDLAVSATGRDGKPAPAGMFAVDTAHVTVPAHGTAGVTVTARPVAAAVGLFGGWLVATGGGTTVRTGIGAYEEPESYDLTVRDIGRGGGRPNFAFAVAVDTADGSGDFVDIDATGVARIRVAKGHYDVAGFDVSTDPATGRPAVTAVAAIDVAVNADATATLDATNGRPVTATIDRPGAAPRAAALSLTDLAGEGGGTVSFLDFGDTALYAVPTPKVTGHPFVFDYRPTFESPAGSTDPYRYNLVFDTEGRIPAATTYRARDRDLATVRTDYHAQGAPTGGVRGDYGRLASGAGPGLFPAFPEAFPGRRTEYFSTAGLTWLHLGLIAAPGGRDGETLLGLRGYRPGRYGVDWNSAPIGPALGNRDLGWGVRRVGDNLAALTPLFSAGEDEHFTSSAFTGGVTGTTTLTRGGTVVGTSNLAGVGEFTLPADAGRYTLTASGTRAVPWSVLGSRVDAAWTFDSAHVPGTDPQFVPLLAVRAGIRVDENDTATAGRPHVLRLDVDRQAGHAPLTGLTLDVSYDDGATWQPSHVIRLGHHGLALLWHPAAAGFVSLRTSARDAAGNTVTQTVLRAYQIR